MLFNIRIKTPAYIEPEAKQLLIAQMYSILDTALEKHPELSEYGDISISIK